jgi:hypothetical protein
MAGFLDLIPENIDPEIRQSPGHFTRTRKLPFQKLVTFILSLVAGGKSKGVDIKSGEFFKNARRSGLWPEAEAVHRCSLSRSRKKLPWTVFRDILKDAVDLAYKLWPRDPSCLWHGMPVVAIDGSKYDLPATEENRKEFDPRSGFDHEGRGHYPQCLVSTAYDVFRRIPVARTVVGIHGSEREEVPDLVASIRPGAVLLFDRGYRSYHLIRYLREHYQGYFLFRCPAESTFPAVEEFVAGGRREGYILLHPSNGFLQSLSRRQRKKAKVIQLRIVRLVSPDGTVSVLLTNLLNQSVFPLQEIISLYFRRWEIEGNYRNEKTVLEIEQFHGKSANSIRQELYAVAVMSVIARTLMVVTSRVHGPSGAEFQFKNAIMTLAAEAAILAPDDPDKAIEIFREILAAISRVRYYRPKTPRASQPRVTKRPPDKWCAGRRKKLENP